MSSNRYTLTMDVFHGNFVIRLFFYEDFVVEDLVEISGYCITQVMTKQDSMS